jgi:hypothetical protein
MHAAAIFPFSRPRPCCGGGSVTANDFPRSHFHGVIAVQRRYYLNFINVRDPIKNPYAACRVALSTRQINVITDKDDVIAEAAIF